MSIEKRISALEDVVFNIKDKDAKCRKFNVNGLIKVRLSKKGYDRMAYKEGRLNSNGETDVDYFAKKADKDGYITMQMTSFMWYFGDEPNDGYISTLYDFNIIIL